MSVNIKTTLQKAANTMGVSESAANLLADYMIKEGYELSKPTKNPPDQKEIEKQEEAAKRQGTI